MARISASKTGPKSVSPGSARPQMVLGSRPPGMYAPRIKPLDASTRQYGKKNQDPAGADPTGVGFSPFLGGSNGRPV